MCQRSVMLGWQQKNNHHLVGHKLHYQHLTLMSKPERKPIVCFVCHQQGHKSPQCLKRETTVKHFQIPINQVVTLKQNEVFGKIKGHVLPITCNSCADK